MDASVHSNRPSDDSAGAEQFPARVSVIVAVYNAGATLQRCLESIIRQDHADVEIVVIDGASTDGSVDIIRAHDAQIATWRSGPDDGIYDAWNKALEHVTGAWVCFLGADDEFAAPDSISKLIAAAQQDTDLVFGRVQLVDEQGTALRILGEPWNWSRMKRMPTVAHPGALHKRTLFRRFGNFDQRYRIAGDYEFLLRVGADAKASFLDDVVVRFANAGASSSDARRRWAENRDIHARHPEIGPRRAMVRHGVGLARVAVGRALGR